MHRIATTLSLAISFLGTTASAQQSFGLLGPSAFTSRGNLGTGAGELLQGFPTAHHRGIGEQAGGCLLQGFRLVMQDQESSTAATYEIVIRGGSGTGGPTTQLARVGPLSLPPGGGGAAAWRVTTSFQTPITLPGCDQFFAAGVALPAAPSWNTDGLSARIEISSNAHARAISHAWQTTAAGTQRLTTASSWMFELRTDASLLQIGAGTDRYGLEGIFPGTGNDITARARFAPTTFGGGICAVWLGTWRQPGTVLFPGTAKLYLSGTFIPAGRRAIGANGEVEMTIARNIPASVGGAGIFHLQAAGLNGSTVGLTNTFSILP